MTILRLLPIVLQLTFLFSKFPISASSEVNPIERLPTELFCSFLDYCDDLDISKVRLLSKSLQERIQEYLELRRLDPASVKIFGVLNTWQLSHLTDCRVLNMRVVRMMAYGQPSRPTKHLKLLRFISLQPAFKDLYDELRSDTRHFLTPQINYYSRQIHGLDEFLEIMRVEADEEEREKWGDCAGWYYPEDFGVAFVFMEILGYFHA